MVFSTATLEVVFVARQATAQQQMLLLLLLFVVGSKRKYERRN